MPNITFCISEVKRWGDVKTDKKTAKRVKIGWLFQSMIRYYRSLDLLIEFIHLLKKIMGGK